MAVREKDPAREIVRAAPSGLVVLSSPLVLRGLREFPQTPRWSVRQAFPSPRANVAISSAGFTASCAEDERLSGRIEIADLERSGHVETVEFPETRASSHNGALLPQQNSPQPAAAFSWEPSGLGLVTPAQQGGFHYFSARQKRGATAFRLRSSFDDGSAATRGAKRGAPGRLAWSRAGEYFAAATGEGEHAIVSLWMSAAGAKNAGAAAQFEFVGPWQAASLEQDSADDAESNELAGIGALDFHPRGKITAVVLKYRGEWCDDALALVRVPQMRGETVLETSGEVTDLSWTHDGKHLVFCASGQLYAMDEANHEITELPLAGELCRCHPSLPLCAFYNSWLKHSARGRICIADLRCNEITDECSADGILDLQWSNDGMILYAVAHDGVAYIYERPWT